MRLLREHVGVPYRPPDLRQALKMGREWALGASFVRRDAAFRLRDLSFDVRNRPLRGVDRPGDLAGPESCDFQGLEGLAVFPKLDPLPGDVAIAVSDHVAAALELTGRKSSRNNGIYGANLSNMKDRLVWLTFS